jgi:ATP-dependent Clp protease adaptor protein ClpS
LIALEQTTAKSKPGYPDVHHVLGRFGKTLRRATSIARAQNRASAEPEDLLLALTEDDETAAAFIAAGTDLGLLRRDIATLFEDELDEPSPDLAEAAFHTPAIHALFEDTIDVVRASGRDVVTSGDILGVLISNTVGFALEEQGVTRHDLLSYISHGVAETDAIAAPVAPAGEASAVFILNDHFTPMEFVVQVLRDMFGLTEDDAERITRETHHSGRGACGVFPRAVAIDLVRRVEGAAREQQHPLHCLLLPPQEAGGQQANS